MSAASFCTITVGNMVGAVGNRQHFIYDVIARMKDTTDFAVGGKPVSGAEWRAAFLASVRRQRAATLQILDPRGEFLQGRGRNVTSQFGEDGLLAATFEQISTRNQFCFEVGAGNGITLSNTKALRNAGWSALLIEADAALFARLAQTEATPRCICRQQRIGASDLDAMLQECHAPPDLDLGIIDIDGQDWWVFEGLRCHRPRVLLVEYCPAGGPVPPLDGPGQAGLAAILDLAAAKWYVPLARTNVNVLLVAEEELES